MEAHKDRKQREVSHKNINTLISITVQVQARLLCVQLLGQVQPLMAK
jgi:hypothetical protein